MTANCTLPIRPKATQSAIDDGPLATDEHVTLSVSTWSPKASSSERALASRGPSICASLVKHFASWTGQSLLCSYPGGGVNSATAARTVPSSLRAMGLSLAAQPAANNVTSANNAVKRARNRLGMRDVLRAKPMAHGKRSGIAAAAARLSALIGTGTADRLGPGADDLRRLVRGS